MAGVPNLHPEGLASRAATEYGDGGNLIEMIRQNLVAERIVIEYYQELIRYFGDKNPTARIMPPACTICWSPTRVSRS